MKVLLVSANTEQINMPAMPLGLACVAAAVRKAGHEVSLLDLMFEMNAASTLQQAINEFQPECIGISVRNIDDQNIETPGFLLDKVKEVVAVCRRLSKATIVLGGAGYSMFPEKALVYLDADMGIAGEGETAFPALLKRLETKEDPFGIPGLFVREKQSHREPQQWTKQLDTLPLPHTFILSSSTSKNKEPWIPVQTRRGCGLKCSYCSTPFIEGSILRMRTPEIIIAWLASWVDAGFSNFFFVDNTFNLPPDYAKTLCRLLSEKGLQINWQAIIYPKNIDEELVSLMATAGCRQISLGFESGSEHMLKNLNKRFTLDDVRSISQMFADHSIRRMGFLMLGTPGETRESVEESLVFADSLNLDALRLTMGVRIYPNTRLALTAIKQGTITPQCDLLNPRFYLEKGMESWLSQRLSEWRATRPHVIM